MNATQRKLMMQRWNVIQHELLPELRHEVGVLTPKLEKGIDDLEWVCIEESLGHVPLIDHNASRSDKIKFDPPQTFRKCRTHFVWRQKKCSQQVSIRVIVIGFV